MNSLWWKLSFISSYSKILGLKDIRNKQIELVLFLLSSTLYLIKVTSMSNPRAKILSIPNRLFTLVIIKDTHMSSKYGNFIKSISLLSVLGLFKIAEHNNNTLFKQKYVPWLFVSIPEQMCPIQVEKKSWSRPSSLTSLSGTPILSSTTLTSKIYKLDR